MEEPQIAVVAPLARELTAFRRGLHRIRVLRRAGHRWTVGHAGETAVLTAVLGDGRQRAEATLGTLFTNFHLRHILLLGVAGGLDPSLKVGQVVAAARVFDGEHPAPPPDPAGLAAMTTLGIPTAAVITVPRIVTRPRDKARLWQNLGGERPAVVDLESAALAHAAATAGVPYLILRAVSDGAHDTLPPFLARCQRTDGSTNQAKVALAALLSPRSIPELLRLRRRVERCSAALANTAQNWLAPVDRLLKQ